LKIRKTRQNGFVMLIVIAALSLIGFEMFILARSSNTVVFQTNSAYVESCEQNLVASGLAWAKMNIESENQTSLNKTIELSLAGMNIQRAALSVFVQRAENKPAEVQITSSCSRGRQTLRHKKKYLIGS
jgi:hypothetical protein